MLADEEKGMPLEQKLASGKDLDGGETEVKIPLNEQRRYDEIRKRKKELAKQWERYNRILKREQSFNKFGDFFLDIIRLYAASQIFLFALGWGAAHSDDMRAWNKDFFERKISFEAKFFGVPGYWVASRIFDGRYDDEKRNNLKNSRNTYRR